MRSYLAFTKKELMESTRTYKLFVLLIIFMLFGFMNPIIAKVMPEVLSSFLPEGMIINLEEPKALDSWMQFFKNISQTGMIVLVVVFSGIMANEINKGTLEIMRTKGLSRRTIILSKFTASALLWSAAYVLCFGITYIYTEYLWDTSEIRNLPLAMIAMWLFGILLLVLTIFGGLLFKSIYGSLLFTGGVVIILTILGIFPDAAPYNPMSLISQGVPLLNGEFMPQDIYTAMAVTLVLIVIFLMSSLIDWIRLS